MVELLPNGYFSTSDTGYGVVQDSKENVYTISGETNITGESTSKNLGSATLTLEKGSVNNS